MKINLISPTIIINTIENLQNELLSNIKLDNCKYYCEELTEYLLLIISNAYITISKDLTVKENMTTIHDKILNISKLKNKEFPSITNKIIFKHKDIVEKYLQNNT